MVYKIACPGRRARPLRRLLGMSLICRRCPYPHRHSYLKIKMGQRDAIDKEAGDAETRNFSLSICQL